MNEKFMIEQVGSCPVFGAYVVHYNSKIYSKTFESHSAALCWLESELYEYQTELENMKERYEVPSVYDEAHELRFKIVPVYSLYV